MAGRRARSPSSSSWPRLAKVLALSLITASCLFLSHSTYVRKRNAEAEAVPYAGDGKDAHGDGRLEPQAATAAVPLLGEEENPGVFSVHGRDAGRSSRVGATASRPSSSDDELGLELRVKSFPLRHLRRAIWDRFGITAWDSCAVVGNSGNALLGKGHGARIDAHEAVMRLNLAPTEGHLDDLGARTTLAFINGWKLHDCASSPTKTGNASGDCSKCWQAYKEGRGVRVVSSAITEAHASDGRACAAASPTKFYLVRDDFDRFADSVVHHHTSERIKANFPAAMWAKLAEERRKVRLYSSTGLKAAISALCLCKRASLFGFGKFDPSLGGQHHYFESQTLEEVPDHDYEAEAIFYRKMQDRSASLARVFDETNQNLTWYA